MDGGLTTVTRERMLSGGSDGLRLQEPRSRLRADVPDDRAIAYRVSLREVFDGLRALIGQVSGLLILAQARRGRDLRDMPTIAVARERWREAVETLGRLDPPADRAADRERLRLAADHIDAVLARIDRMRGGLTDPDIMDAARHLTAAYRLLQSICDHSIGLAMVDLRDACCCCGRTLGFEGAGT